MADTINQTQPGQDINPYSPLWQQMLQWLTKAGTVGPAMAPQAAPQGSTLPQLTSPSPAVRQQAANAAAGLTNGAAVSASDMAASWLTSILKNTGVWVIIALVALIGLWGLVSPGGGVAVIDRARR